MAYSCRIRVMGYDVWFFVVLLACTDLRAFHFMGPVDSPTLKAILRSRSSASSSVRSTKVF